MIRSYLQYQFRSSRYAVNMAFSTGPREHVLSQRRSNEKNYNLLLESMCASFYASVCCVQTLKMQDWPSIASKVNHLTATFATEERHSNKQHILLITEMGKVKIHRKQLECTVIELWQMAAFTGIARHVLHILLVSTEQMLPTRFAPRAKTSTHAGASCELSFIPN